MRRVTLTLPLLSLLLIPAGVVGQTPIAETPPPLPPLSVGEKLYMADQTTDTLYVLEDLDQDGDANDAGEITIFYDATAPDPALHLVTPQFIAVGTTGALYVGDSNLDHIIRLEDLDQDGTANQAGEAQLFYDATSGGPALVSINNIAFDGAGYLFYTDNGTSSTTDRHIVRMRDDNGDGFCSAADGEVDVIYELSTTTGQQIARPSGMAIDADGMLVISNYDDDNLYRLYDTAGAEDGDANDPGEQQLAFSATPGGVALSFAQSIIFGPEEAGGVMPLYVNDGPPDTIYRFADINADGIYENPVEINIFWDPSQADGIIPGTAWRMAAHPSGALFVAEGGSTSAGVPDQIVVLKDLDGDGSANGPGEASVFADNGNASGITFERPHALAFELPPPLPTPLFIRGDSNVDGLVNIADAVHGLGYLFLSLPADCLDAVDVNDSGVIDLADPIYLLSSLFVPLAPLPPLPYPDCGEDPAPPDTLDCMTSCP